jgi:hypothetical protein
MKRNHEISIFTIVISILLLTTVFFPVVNAQYANIFSVIDNKIKLPPTIDKYFEKNEEDIIIPKNDNQVFQSTVHNNPLPLNNSNWWNTEWPYRKLISIDHNIISSTLIDYPLLVYFNQDSDIAVHAQSDGDDFVFIDYADNSSKLNHEIELYDSGLGTGVFWINIPILSSSMDTKVWMYYGNLDCLNQENIIATWNSDYVMVQHLNEVSGSIYDSTVNDNDGISYGAIFNASGKIDGSYEFDGINDYIDVGSYDVAGSGLTLSMWFNADAFTEVFATSGVRLISKARGPETSDHYWMLAISDNGDKFRFRIKTENSVTANLITSSGGSLLTNQWYYVTATYDGTAMKIYRDSVFLGSKSISGALSTNATVPVWIGANPPNIYRPWDGVLDEVRVSQIARNESWISTSHNNQLNPQGFSNVSIEEPYQYSLDISVNGNGNVTKNPDQLSYEYGSLVTLTAVADIGWSFNHWSGDLSGSANPIIINITEDESVTAHFTQDHYTLSISIVGNGTVLKNPNQLTYIYGLEF